MNFNEDTLTIYYKHNDTRDKEALSYAQSLRPHVHEINVMDEPPTLTQLKEIADNLQVDVEELVDKRDDLYKEQYQDKSFDAENWLLILTQNPTLIKTPIIFIGNRGTILDSPRDIIKFGASSR